jgi:hypothetical protein
MWVARAWTNATRSEGALAGGHGTWQAQVTRSESALARDIDRVEQIKASIRAKVEHPFRIVEQQFGYAKLRYRGLAKNTAADHAVRAEQSVDGPTANAGCAGMNAPAMRQWARDVAQNGPPTAVEAASAGRSRPPSTFKLFRRPTGHPELDFADLP